MNILLVENSSRDFFTARLSYAKFLRDKGCNVYILVPNDGFVKQIESNGFEVNTYSIANSRHLLSSILNVYKAYRFIFKNHKIDIVHSYRFFPNLFNIFTSGFSKRRVVLHITGLGIVYAGKNLKFRIYKLISNILYFISISLADKVIVQNPDDKKDISFTNRLQKKIKLIEGSGVDTAFFNFSIEDRTAVRMEKGIPDRSLVFVCITRLIWEKGIKELVEAFKNICITFPQAQLVIVGDPDTSNPNHIPETYMQANNTDSIQFWGRQPNIKEILCAADVFIFPSYYREGIPRGILEALSIGLPVITTNTPGCSLTVNQGRNGLLIEPRSVSAIEQAVVSMIQSSNQLADMRVISRKIAEERFAEKIVFEQMYQTYIG